jgi:hypothetical protein
MVEVRASIRLFFFSEFGFSSLGFAFSIGILQVRIR